MGHGKLQPIQKIAFMFNNVSLESVRKYHAISHGHCFAKLSISKHFELILCMMSIQCIAVGTVGVIHASCI